VRFSSGAISSALLVAVLFLAGCGIDDDVVVIRAVHPHDRSHPVHDAMVFLDQRLQELSGGTMRMDIYTSSQLGTERESLELLQIGSLGITKVSTSVLDGFAPAFQVFGLPFLFRDEAHRLAVLDGPIGRELLTRPEPFRLRGLTYYDAGARSFYTVRRPVHSPADLAGLKIRTQESMVAMRMVSALGASPTPMAFGEVYTALQQGVVDGAENNPPSFLTTRHYEVARYYSLDEHTAVPDVLVIGTAVWRRLTAQQRAWLQQAADDSFDFQRGAWQEATEEAMRVFEAAGVQIIRPEKEAFARAVEPLLASFRADPQMGPLIAAIQAVGADGADH
jgi:tripartite ATP-independent transporter DctP family solute receptor